MTVQINGTNGIQFPDGINLNIDKLFSANGYQKLPGGLIIQWGQSANITTDGQNTVLYPIAFPNATLKVIATPRNSSAIGTDVAAANVVSFTASQAVLYLGSVNAGVTMPVDYIAIGY